MSISDRTRNHMKAPRSASFVASLRQVFGEVKVLYVKENDVEIGEPQPQGATCFIVGDVVEEKARGRKAA